MKHHPFSILSEAEIGVARDVIISVHPHTVINFRTIYLQEPPKDLMKEYLALEHSGELSPTSSRVPRLALCQYDVISSEKESLYHESIVDIGLRKRVTHDIVSKQYHASLTLYVSFIS